MKYFKYLLIIPFFWNCSGDREPILPLKDFEYPLDSLDKGKIFVFKRNPAGEYFYMEQKRAQKAGADLILQECYTSQKRLSASTYKITKSGMELTDYYFYRYPDSLTTDFTKDKAEVYALKNITTGQKYRGFQKEMTILMNHNIKVTMIEKETFQHEDKLTLNNHYTVDVLVFSNEIKTSARQGDLPLSLSPNESIAIGESVYGRQLGLVKFTTKDNNQIFDWELVDIKNIE